MELLSYFERIGLCKVDFSLATSVNVTLHAEAYDMARCGGFVAQEKLFKQNIQKLMLELEQLRLDIPETKMRIITEIIGQLGSLAAKFMF